MSVHALPIEDICRDASLALALPDAEALGAGRAAVVEGVAFEVHHEPLINAVLILADIGRASADDRALVYEQMLELQVLVWAQSSSRFGFNSERGTLLLTVSTSLGPGKDGPWLAALVRSMAKQIHEWREGLLAGRLKPPAGWRDAVEARDAAASQQVSRDGRVA